MTPFPIPAFSDNYIWAMHDGQRAVVVDPGEPAGVLAWLASEAVSLDTILITHHHPDHTGGVAELRERTGARVIGPVRETMPEPLQRVDDGENVTVLGHNFTVIAVPGHTLGHIAYFCPDVSGEPLLFCGDTLFSAGCGRLFEGTPAQMHASLSRLAALPDNTWVCCTHEYTLANLRFAQAVEPNNQALQAHARKCADLRSLGKPTLPSNLGLEKSINPFLRCTEPDVVRAATIRAPEVNHPDAQAVFATLREWKNQF
ncbi:hydroxyacylglutathione hydrolase [Hydrogenophaga crassostreae]|uniref:Hydroxyacylglutathione hydrolase n=1 Tax=Hydrogenophaga crassostreae TaxID=1763535 RepID=A0A162T2R2_9BURK|nr:hydroxyacylglutathione hydrolase [Hydrogenophaga crassostreae]AOW13112.1 hydroxyacylglutathione hydrolase [Hydrogenophaga crassostreae]OAD42743.1 hydroxyacylglutathione hydrolase [Hydrogenophaga crassostreae]